MGEREGKGREQRRDLQRARNSRFGLRIDRCNTNSARSRFADRTRRETQIFLVGIVFDLKEKGRANGVVVVLPRKRETCPKTVRFFCLDSSVIPSRSLRFLSLLPPRFFFDGSMGGGNGLIALTGGGSSNFSNRFSISWRNSRPFSPFGL